MKRILAPNVRGLLALGYICLMNVGFVAAQTPTPTPSSSSVLQKAPMQKSAVQSTKKLVDLKSLEKSLSLNAPNSTSASSSNATMVTPSSTTSSNAPLIPAMETISAPQPAVTTSEASIEPTLAPAGTDVTVLPVVAPTGPNRPTQVLQKAPMQKIAYKKPALTAAQIALQERAALKAQYLGR